MNDFLGCEYRTWLDLEVDKGLPCRRKLVVRTPAARGAGSEATRTSSSRSWSPAAWSCHDPAWISGRPSRRESHRGGDARRPRGDLPGVLRRRRLARLSGLPRPHRRAVRARRAGPTRSTTRSSAVIPQPRHVFQLLFYSDAARAPPGPAAGADAPHPGRRRAPRAAARATSRLTARSSQRGSWSATTSSAGALTRLSLPGRDCEFCHWWHVCEERRRATTTSRSSPTSGASRA